MPTKYLDKDQQIDLFGPLEQGQAQIESSSMKQEIKIIVSPEIKEQFPKIRRQQKIRKRSTNLVIISPIKNCLQDQYKLKQGSSGIRKSSISPQKEQRTNETSFNQQDNIRESLKSINGPVLIEFSDDQDLQPRQHNIPQSSRRPFKEKQIQFNQQTNDQRGRPVQSVRSPRKATLKQSPAAQNGKRFIKMKRSKKNLKQPENIQIYEYDDGQNNGQNNQQENSQQENSQQENSRNNSKQKQEGNQNQNNSYSNNKKEIQCKIVKPQLVVLKSNSFYTLINAQIPKNNFVNCIIRRKRTEGLFDTMVTYQLYLLQDKKYLMTCVKNRMLKATSHFQFYREKIQSHNQYHKQNLYACLNSNFTGTEFVLKTIIKNDTISEDSTAEDKTQFSRFNQSATKILDSNKKATDLFPNQTKKNANHKNQQIQQQKQACYISFKANLFGLAGQREVNILKKNNKKLTKTGKFSDLKEAQQNGQIDKYHKLSSKTAILGKNGLQLDLKKIAKMQSTKNIVLEDKDSNEVLIFGKVKQDIYSISIGSPFSIIEGLAFGIANLDRKLFVN